MATALERVLAEYKAAIREGMARTLWVTAYGDFVEEQRNSKARGHADLERPGPGEDWEDYAPATPEAAEKAADDLIALFEAANDGSPVVQMFGVAMQVDRGRTDEYDLLAHKDVAHIAGVTPDTAGTKRIRKELARLPRSQRCDPSCPGWAVFDGDNIQRCDECARAARRVVPGNFRILDDEVARLPEAKKALAEELGETDLVIAEEFGSDLAMMGLGTGVSWFDGHKDRVEWFVFEIHGPRHFECSFDGRYLTWDGGNDDTGLKMTGLDLGRIIDVNPDDVEYTRHRYVFSFHAGMTNSGPLQERLLLIHANDEGDALDEGIDWVVENAPGHLADDEVHEAYDDAIRNGLSQEAAHDLSEMDYMSGGNAGNFISRENVQIIATDPTDEQLVEIGHAER